MTWQSALWIVGFAVFFWIMMRSCGGMKGGGCGMGGRRRDAAAPGSELPRADTNKPDDHRAT